MTDNRRFASVWDAIENTPQEAASMRARSMLMMSLVLGVMFIHIFLDIIRRKINARRAARDTGQGGSA